MQPARRERAGRGRQEDFGPAEMAAGSGRPARMVPGRRGGEEHDGGEEPPPHSIGSGAYMFRAGLGGIPLRVRGSGCLSSLLSTSRAIGRGRHSCGLHADRRREKSKGLGRHAAPGDAATWPPAGCES